MADVYLWSVPSDTNPADIRLRDPTTFNSGSPSGSLATTEAADTAAFAGNWGVSGSLAVTEAPDTAAFAGNSGTSGTLASTEAPDTAAFAGTFADQGALAATEAADVAAFAGTFADLGALAATEGADVAAFAGSFADLGALAVTEAADTAAFALAFDTEGALVVTEAADIAAFTDAGGTPPSGSLVSTESPDIAALFASFLDTSGVGQTVLTSGKASGTFSRKQYQEFKEAERARIAAEAKAKQLEKKQREALISASEITQDVIARAGLFSSVVAIKSLTLALTAATNANSSDVINKSLEAIRIAENLLAAMEDDEEDIMLLMSMI